MKSAKWGIIGPGSIAHDFVKDLDYVSIPQEVVAVLGRTDESAENFARTYGIPQWYSNLDSFLDNSGVEAVYISTPHTLHYEQAMACLERKIPVLCEKPMTINLDQATMLIEAAKANETFLRSEEHTSELQSRENLVCRL